MIENEKEITGTETDEKEEENDDAWGYEADGEEEEETEENDDAWSYEADEAECIDARLQEFEDEDKEDADDDDSGYDVMW